MVAMDEKNNRILFIKEEEEDEESQGKGRLTKGDMMRHTLLKGLGVGQTDIKIQGTFEPIPSKLGHREIIYITAPSGAGKSFWVSQYCRNYQLMYPKNKVVLFSRLADDTSLDSVKNMIRIELTEELIDDPIDIQAELKDACVIFDDTDTIGDKKIRKAVMDLMDDILQTGRHSNTTALITSHLSTNYKETRIILAEAHKFVIFPKSSTRSTMDRLLDNYLGFDKKERQMIYNLKSRWVQIYKHHPRYILTQKEAKLIQ